MHEITIHCQNIEELRTLLGHGDVYLHFLQKEFPSCHFSIRGTNLCVQGDVKETDIVIQTSTLLRFLQQERVYITEQHVRYIVQQLHAGNGQKLKELYEDTINTSARGRLIKAKTFGQKAYIDSIRKHIVTFGIGPAGTGKTYMAVALAAYYLRNQEVERIILTRPAVEAGEKLGFLPGDLQDKIDPYLRPLYDALADMFGGDKFQKLAAKNIIEVAPLAYMRGRTLEHSFIILDEAQNTTKEQMKMFLTRLGNHSRIVVNGDVSQIDLPDHRQSGLVEAVKILSSVKGIGIVHLTAADVVRHTMVSRIIRAYEAYHEPK
ncbi:phosphate starvation-inducible protein PhoH [Veillonellaceae bacterium M2-4]|nr:phosphate starvation-inducible protein PhoH [Veillonellaceae bacterium M2-4]